MIIFHIAGFTVKIYRKKHFVHGTNLSLIWFKKIKYSIGLWYRTLILATERQHMFHYGCSPSPNVANLHLLSIPADSRRSLKVPYSQHTQKKQTILIKIIHEIKLIETNLAREMATFIRFKLRTNPSDC